MAPKAALLTEDPGDATNLLKGNFSLNHQVLVATLRPLVQDIHNENRLLERLVELEAGSTKLQINMEHKAEKTAVREVAEQVYEHRGQIAQKADQTSVNDVVSAIRGLEDQLSWKADNQQMEEHDALLQRLKTGFSAKADLSFVNRTNAALQKLTQTVTSMDAFTVDIASALEKLESHQLPQGFAKVRDNVNTISGSIRSIEETLAVKADQRTMEDLVVALKELETGLSWKASQQSLVELSAEVHDMQHQFLLAALKSELEELRAVLTKTSNSVIEKADQQKVNEMYASMQGLERSMFKKADVDETAEMKTRQFALESRMETKSDHQEFKDFQTMVVTLQDKLSDKADGQTVREHARTLAAVENEVNNKADSEAFRDLSKSVNRILQEKADKQTVAEDVQDLNFKVDGVLELVNQKANLQQFEDVVATVEVLASGMSQTQSMPTVPTHSFSPNSSTAGSLRSGTLGSAAGTPIKSGYPSRKPTISRGRENRLGTAVR